jgi:hypothetical protein
LYLNSYGDWGIESSFFSMERFWAELSSIFRMILRISSSPVTASRQR